MMDVLLIIDPKYFTKRRKLDSVETLIEKFNIFLRFF